MAEMRSGLRQGGQVNAGELARADGGPGGCEEMKRSGPCGLFTMIWPDHEWGMEWKGPMNFQENLHCLFFLHNATRSDLFRLHIV